MRKRKRTLLTLLLVLMLFATACSNTNNKSEVSAIPTPTAQVVTITPELTPTLAPTPTPEPVVSIPTEPAGFYVDGTKLYDVKGNEFIMRGINHAHTWYKGWSFVAFDAIAATGANTIRVVLSDGQQWQADDLMSVKSIIDTCKSLNMVAVLEVHDATGSNSAEDLDKAVDYWIGLKNALISNEQYVIINIANEWYGDWKSRDWADGYIAAIKKLRDAGFSHTILVDSAGWGQYSQSINEFGTEVFEADPIKNTMFAIHMYEYSGKDEATIKTNIDAVREQNLCVTIGEFGFKHLSGDVDEDYIMRYCNDIGVGYIGWSWKGNSTEVAYLDIAKEWDGSVLTDDWGEKLINGDYGIRNTAKVCSVFEQ